MERSPPSDDFEDVETQRYVYVASPVDSEISQTTEVLDTLLQTPQQTPSQSPLLPLAQGSRQSSPQHSSSPFPSPSPPSMELPQFVSPAPTPSPAPSPSPQSPPTSEPIDPSQSPMASSMSSAVQPAVSVRGRGEGRTAERVIVAEGLGGASDSFQRSSPLAGSIRRTSSDGIIVAEELSGASNSISEEVSHVFPEGVSASNVGGAANPFWEELRHTNPIWLVDYLPHTAGWAVDGIETRLFATDKLIQLDSDFVDLLDESMKKKFAFDRHAFFVDLFFRWRFFKKREESRHRIHPDDLTISWSAFVIHFYRNPSTWVIERYRKAEVGFMEHTTIGPMMAVHVESVRSGHRCAVPPEPKCPFCYKSGPSMPRRYDPSSITASLLLAITRLNQRIQSTAFAARNNEALKAVAQESQASSSTEITDLRQENEDLQRRLAAIEQTAKRRRPSSR